MRKCFKNIFSFPEASFVFLNIYFPTASLQKIYFCSNFSATLFLSLAMSLDCTDLHVLLSFHQFYIGETVLTLRLINFHLSPIIYVISAFRSKIKICFTSIQVQLYCQKILFSTFPGKTVITF